MTNAPAELPDEKTTPLIGIKWNGSVLILRLVGPNIGQRESPIITEEFACIRCGDRFLRHRFADNSGCTRNRNSRPYGGGEGDGSEECERCAEWRAAVSRGRHIITSPPSTPSTWPVTYEASGEAR